MREIVTLAAIVAISACGASLPPATTDARSASATREVSPPAQTPAAAAPSDGPTLPLTSLGFACRLPVYSHDGGVALDFFIDFPRSSVTAASGQGTFYDPVVARWLPVFRNQVSPDGLTYAYTEGWGVSPSNPLRLHIVDAASGADVRVVSLPQTLPYFVLDFTDSYIDVGLAYEGRGPGVWRIDLGSDVVTKVSEGIYPPGAQWVSVVDPRDAKPNLSTLSGMPQPNRIDRRDSMGDATTWFYRPGHSLSSVAFAGDSALLVESGWTNMSEATGGIEFWLVTAPNQATELASYMFGQPSPYEDLADGFFGAIVDDHGIWIGGQHSLHLVSSAGSILRVYAESAYPAGPCD
jgi:hypothetical protein